MMRFIPIAIFVLFAALATVMLLHKKPAAPHSASFAMPELQLATLEGEARTLALQEGLAVVNFFASWCTPCLAEHKELVALKEQFPDVMFHGVAWNDTTENIRTMLDTHGNPYDAVWADARGQAAIALGIRGIPETYIVKNGRVIYHLSGPIVEAIRKNEIEVLLEPLP